MKDQQLKTEVLESWNGPVDDRKRYVVTEGSKSPPLMLIYPHYLTAEARRNVTTLLSAVLESGKSFVIDGGVEVYQLIDGRWIHLDGSIEIVDGPKVEPTKVNFKEFL